MDKSLKNSSLPLKIVGIGMYVPSKVETAAEVGSRIGRSEDWVISRAGVKYRHVAEEPTEVMAAKAAQQALKNVPPDLIINPPSARQNVVLRKLVG